MSPEYLGGVGGVATGGVAALDPPERASEKLLRLDAILELGRHRRAGALTAAELDEAIGLLEAQFAIYGQADTVRGWA